MQFPRDSRWSNASSNEELPRRGPENEREKERKKGESQNDGTRKDARLLRSNFSTADPPFGSSTSSDDEGGLGAYTVQSKPNLS